MSDVAEGWLSEQLSEKRELLLVIDRLAEPDPIEGLFSADLMQDYVNLYLGTEYDGMADVGPWLIRLTDPGATFVRNLLDTPNQHWGWLASAPQLNLGVLTKHWRERLVIEEDGQRALYRFQDPRVIARSLARMAADQIPLLLGPLTSALCWEGAKWHRYENLRPGPSIFTQPAPWLYPEPASIAHEIRLANLEQWLWENQPDATTELAKQENIRDWLSERLDLAERWKWTTPEQLYLLLEKNRGALASHAAWPPLPQETAASHFLRCRSTFGPLVNGSEQA